MSHLSPTPKKEDQKRLKKVTETEGGASSSADHQNVQIQDDDTRELLKRSNDERAKDDSKEGEDLENR